MRSDRTGAGERAGGGGVLRRLARDRGGNTMAMMAAFLLPLSALAGSAVDTGRLYLVKIRLQQACDAGALAGRKFLLPSDSTTLDDNAITQAKVFFAQNFPSGLMGTAAFTSTTNPYPFVPTKTTDKQVAATATVTVPMTIMKMFGQPSRAVTVSCEARFDVADTDIVFVLDTTGSMACKPERSDDECSDFTASAAGKTYTYSRPSTSNGVAGYANSTGYAVTEEMNGSTNISRIQALRTAVVNFYKTIANNTDASTKIRYGFVTYSSMVNAGKAVMDMSPSYMVGGSGSGVTTWTYQSRKLLGDYDVNNPGWSDVNKTKDQCAPAKTRSPASGYDSSSRASRVEYQWVTSTNPAKCQTRTVTVGPQWQYMPVTYDVTNYVAGNAVTDPSQVDGSTAQWWGCIEERDTTAGATSFNNDSLPADLDPDLLPGSGASTRWRPYWPDVEYVRPTWNSYPTSNGDDANLANYTTDARMKLGKNGCAKPIQRLKEMSESDVNAFVNAGDFKPLGGTYHDVGMIWGVRLLSNNGIFAADNAPWAGHTAPKKVIVFLTDGDMSPSADAYSLYGVEQLDRRVTNGDSADVTARSKYHNARFLAECTKAKSMGIDVWTVAIDSSANTQLTSCASSASQAFFTTSGSGLDTYFKKIAQQVALLRVSK